MAKAKAKAKAKATMDHAEIQRWVQQRGGYPAKVKQTGGKDDAGILRIDFPGFSGAKTVQKISWDAWFDMFDESDLAFLYEPGGESRFSKLVHRSTVAVEDAQPRQSSRARPRVARRTGTTRKKVSAKKRSSVRKTAKRASAHAPPRKPKARATKRPTSTKRPATSTKRPARSTRSPRSTRAVRGGSHRRGE